MGIVCLFIWEPSTKLQKVREAAHVRSLAEAGIGVEHLVLSSKEESPLTQIRSYLQKKAQPEDSILLAGTGLAGAHVIHYLAEKEKDPRVKAVMIRSALTDPLTAYGISSLEPLCPVKNKSVSLKEYMISLIPDTPLAGADDFTLPCLILHGRKDSRYSYIQAEDLFSAMKDRCPSVPVRLCILPRGDENLALSASVLEQRIQAQEIFNWINQYCAEGRLPALSCPDLEKEALPAPDHNPLVKSANADELAPAAFPEVSKEVNSDYIMEDFLHLRYPGAPAYNDRVKITAWMETQWDSSLPVGFRSFREEIRALNHKTGQIRKVTAGGNHESDPAILSDGTLLFLSNAGLSNEDLTEPLVEQGILEMRKLNELYGARQLYAVKPGFGEKGSAGTDKAEKDTAEKDKAEKNIEKDLAEKETVEQLTNLLHGVKSYSLSPDERYVLIASERYMEADTLEDLQRTRTKEERNALARASLQEPDIITNASFKSDAEYGYKSIRKDTWWVLSLKDRKLTCLADDEHPMKEPIWLPDSRGLLYYRCNESGQIVFCKLLLSEKEENDFLRVAQVIPSFSGCCPCFSSDGRFLLFAANLPGDDFNFARLPYLIPMDTLSGEMLSLKEAVNPIPLIDPYLETDGVIPDDINFQSKGPRRRSFLAMPDGYCYYTGGEQGSVHLCRVPITEKGGAIPETLIGEMGNFHDLVPAGNGLVALFSDPSHLPEVVYLSLDSLAASQNLMVSAVNPLETEPSLQILSKINEEVKEKQVVLPEEIRVSTLDGRDQIQGWILMPSDKKGASDRIPMVIHVHGGPNGFYSTALNPEFQAYTAAGFAVLFCNPRGGSGYNRGHNAMNQAWDNTAMNDILQVLDEALRRHPEINPDRIGMTGGSYGGFQTIWSAAHCSRIKAASALRPFANARMINSCSHSAGGSSKEEHEGFRDALKESVIASPNTYADSISIPFQILCSALDANCIPEGAMQLYETLRTLSPDLPVRLIIYPDANHGLLHSGPRELAVMQLKDNLNWFKAML